MGIAIGLLVVAMVVGLTGRILALPDDTAAETLASDGTRAQQKLFAVARRRVQTVTLTEAEVNALLVRHAVETGAVRLSGLQTRLLGDDRLELHARTPLARVLDEVGLAWLGKMLPAGWRARPLRLRAGARLRIEGTVPPRRLRLDVDEFALGDQWLPAPAVRLLVDPAAVGLLQWRLPDHIDRVEVEPGRVVIGSRS